MSVGDLPTFGKPEIRYPSFNLRENPFMYYDRGAEKENFIQFELIRINATDTIKIMVENGTSHIVVGPRGCGKSTLIDLLGRELDKVYQGVVIFVSCAHAFYDLYQGVYEGLDAENVDEIIGDSDREDLGWDRWIYRPPNTYIKNVEGISVPVPPKNWKCGHKQCPRSFRCDLLKFDTRTRLYDDEHARELAKQDWQNDFLSIMRGLPNRVNCPLYQELVIGLCGLLNRKYEKENYEKMIFILDVPNNLVDTNLRYFTEFIIDLKKATKGVVVLMATHEQYDKLRSKDEFLRWIMIHFPIIDDDGLRRIVESRIKKYSDGEVILPFDEESLHYLIKVSRGNPRALLQKCNQVFLGIIQHKIIEPVKLEMVIDILEGVKTYTGIGDIDMILDVIEGQVGWRKVKWVRAEIDKRFGLDINSARLGRMIKKMGYERRLNNGVEYRFV